MFYLSVKDLPASLKSALESINYNKKDIVLEQSETYTQQSLADKGQRGFTLAVNLATGDKKAIIGSWGGSNMFVKNEVDSDDEKRVLPPNFAIIQGTQGYPSTFARIFLRPENVALLLPNKQSVSKRENALLAVIKTHTSAGRKNFWERYPKSKPTDSELSSLVSRGFLKQNKAGAISITTEGKNAVTVDYAVWFCEGKEQYY